MPYVYSTATCDNTYCKYYPSQKGDSINRIEKKVTIKGGHGVITKALFTPNGVATKVSDEDLEFLLQNESFKRHLDRGFVSYEKKKNIHPEKMVVNMAKEDGSAPLTEKNFKKSENNSTDKLYKGVFRNK